MKKCETCGTEFTEVLPYALDAKLQPATPQDRFCSGLCQLEYDSAKAGMSMYDYLVRLSEQE